MVFSLHIIEQNTVISYLKVGCEKLFPFHDKITQKKRKDLGSTGAKDKLESKTRREIEQEITVSKAQFY